MQVQNRRTLDTLYHTLYADEIKMIEEAEREESLYHHGVEGMSWGDRNGPPYPLGGVDKKVARAEYKAKKEKERRLKKLQRAAKKARKVKAKNAKQEAEILKKKQKLVKEGDLDKIRKNANLFTNEELQYVIERDNQKRALGSKDERTADEKFELAMKRMTQIGDIAANAGKVLSAAKTGADLLTSFKSAKVKDLEAEDKRLSAIKTEFEMRFKGREDSPEAQRFINYAVNNEQYEPSKAEKKVAKQLDKEREAAVKDSKRALKEADERYKEAKKAEKQAEKEADPKYQKKMAEKEQKQALKEAVENADRDRKIAKQEYEKQVKFQQQMDKIAQKDTDKRVKDFAKGLDVDDAWRSIKADNAAKQELKRQFGSVAEETFGKPYTTIGDSSYTHYGSDWATSFLSSGQSWQTYTTQKGWQVIPRKKEVTAKTESVGDFSGHNALPTHTTAYSSGGRSTWASTPAQKVESTKEASSGRTYITSGKDKWSSKPVSSLPKTPIWASLDIDAQLSGKYGGIAPVKIGIVSRGRGKAREEALLRETRMRNMQNKMESVFAPKKTERSSYSGVGSSYAKLQSEARRLASDYAHYTDVAKRANKSIGSVMPPELENRLWEFTMEKGPTANNLFSKYYHKFSPYA